MKSDYIFLPKPETIRAFGIGLLVFVANMVLKQDWTVFDNWQTYALAIAAGAIPWAAQWILGHLAPANATSLKAQMKTLSRLSGRPQIMQGGLPGTFYEADGIDTSLDALPRKTLCGFLVDPTDSTQRHNHSLRAAPFCGKCVKQLTDDPDLAVTVTFTENGIRRHFAEIMAAPHA